MFGHFAVKCVQESKVLLRGSSGQRLQQGMLLQLNNSTTVEMLQAVKADETSYLLVEIWRPDHTLRVNTNPCASCWKKNKWRPSFVANKKHAMRSSLLLSSWIPRRTSLRHSAPLEKKQLFLQFMPIRQKPSKKHSPTYLGLIWTYLNLSISTK